MGEAAQAELRQYEERLARRLQPDLQEALQARASLDAEIEEYEALGRQLAFMQQVLACQQNPWCECRLQHRRSTGMRSNVSQEPAARQSHIAAHALTAPNNLCRCVPLRW
jgi:hypothetical protein